MYYKGTNELLRLRLLRLVDGWESMLFQEKKKNRKINKFYFLIGDLNFQNSIEQMRY
jgi:hypothetical protein